MRLKKRIFAGATCDQVVYTANNIYGKPKQEPRLRFKTEAERAKHRMGIARRHHRALINANFTPAGYYCTFTFDRENEVHSFDDARRERNNFRRRLLYKYKNAKIALYMGRGKGTHRIHFHALLEGIPEEEIRKAWRGGDVVAISHIREHNYLPDGTYIGRDLRGVADYCFDHWTAEQGGNYYSRTNNFVMPEEEKAKEIKREYSPERPPKAPKGYTFLEAYTTPYGCTIYHYAILGKKENKRRKA